MSGRVDPAHCLSNPLSISSTSDAPSPPWRLSYVTVADMVFWIPEPAYRCFFGMLPIVYGVGPRLSPLSSSVVLPKQLGKTLDRRERRAGRQQQMMLTLSSRTLQ